MARYDFPIAGFNRLQNEWSIRFYEAIGLSLLLEAYTSNNSSPEQKNLKTFLITNLTVDFAMVVAYNKAIAELILKRDAKNIKRMLSKLKSDKQLISRIEDEMELSLGLMLDSGVFDRYNIDVQGGIKFFIASKVAKDFIKLYKLDKQNAIKHRYEKQVRKSLLDANINVGKLSSDIFNNITSNYSTHNMWMSQSPEDVACSGPTGETRKIGDPFSNGLIAPPVHYGCACYLVPVK